MHVNHLLERHPIPTTAVGLVGGLALIMTGNLIAALAGGALILLGLLVPFLRLAPRPTTPPPVAEPGSEIDAGVQQSNPRKANRARSAKETRA